MDKALERLKEIDGEVQKLTHISAILTWDQETYMPPQATQERAEQLALLEGLLHDRITSPEVGRLLEDLGVDPQTPAAPEASDLPGSPQDQAFLRELRRQYQRKTRLPKRLVTELARQAAMAQQKWVEARSSSQYSIFAPNLETILKLVAEAAECLGYQEHPYDPLLDEYEPWMKTAELERVFGRFQERLRSLVARIAESGKTVDTGFLEREYAVDGQRDFCLHVLRALGYDFQRGRLDESAHPFTTTLGRSDVRLTTRYNRSFINTAIFGSIHEAGHGLYELGIPQQLRDTLLGDGTSMGIHESQSRLWENLIGRSLPFWKHFYPELKSRFPEALADITLEDFYRGINAVKPSLIRVEADEVTYNLHILLRFNIEKKLLTGDLTVRDLPAAWNEQSRSLLGVTPPDDAQGVLQDIHWSMGAIGYFPTYSLGNLYSVQLYRTMAKELRQMEEDIQQGSFQGILDWLRERVHSQGRIYPAGELCRRITGEVLNPDYYMDYLEDKYSRIYGI